jgi:probable poly-beta-1,6-N-acetyl-D-glucosamine export protein
MELSSNSGIYLLSYLILPFIVLYRSKRLTKFHYNDNFLSKKNTVQVKGLMIIIIVLHHLSKKLTYVGLMFPFKGIGYLAVSMFFFLSGYGLMESRKTKNDFFKSFFSRRFNKVYLPFFLINILTVAVYSIILGYKYTIYEVIHYAMGIKLIDDITWFIIVILMYYLLYYVFFSLFLPELAVKFLIISSLIYSFFCFYIGTGSWWYNSSFCFPIGVYVSLNYKNIVTMLMSKNYIKMIYFLIIVSGILYILSKHFDIFITRIVFEITSSVVFIICSLLLLFKTELNSRVLTFFGLISYEIYLLHMKLYSLYYNSNVIGGYNIFYYVIMLIIISLIFSKMVEYINKYLTMA